MLRPLPITHIPTSHIEKEEEENEKKEEEDELRGKIQEMISKYKESSSIKSSKNRGRKVRTAIPLPPTNTNNNNRRRLEEEEDETNKPLKERVTIFIFSLKWLAKWYYQFNDSLAFAMKELGLNVIQVYDVPKLARLVKREDIVLCLNNPIDLKGLGIEGLARRLHLSLILYETESMESRKKITSNVLYDVYSPVAVWSYSMWNVVKLREKGLVNVSYVPPSYSPTCDYRSHPSSHSSLHPITFVQRWVGGKRVQPLTEQNISFTNVHAWNDQTFATNVSSHHILINVHKSNWNVLEVFRLAPALSNGMRVVTEPSIDLDMMLFQSFVTFKEVEGMREVIDGWIEEGKDLTKRLEIRDAIAENFKRNFHIVNFVRDALSSINPELVVS